MKEETSGWSIFGKLMLALILIIIPMSLILKACGAITGWWSKAIDVVSEELSPKELLRKYTWFKDCAAVLDKKQADIEVYDTKAKSILKDYEGVPRKDWPRDERETIRQWETEFAGIKASYNQLAAEYNSQMSKINWRFCNVGGLPQGANQVLPREYREYLVK